MLETELGPLEEQQELLLTLSTIFKKVFICIWNASGMHTSLHRGHTILCIIPSLVYVVPKQGL